MPLTGTDFTPQQRQALRVMADYLSPGLSDTQVLAWATEQGVEGAMRAAYALFVKRVQDDTNEARAGILRPVQAVVEAGEEE